MSLGRKPGFNLIESVPQYRQLQDLILDKTGVECSVVVKPGIVSIRAKDYTDYVLARAAIKGQLSENIVRDI